MDFSECTFTCFFFRQSMFYYLEIYFQTTVNKIHNIIKYIKMIIDMRKRDVPPGYGGHVPCRNEVYGLCEGKALKLAVATYELF